jgi:hypothetical protein
MVSIWFYSACTRDYLKIGAFLNDDLWLFNNCSKITTCYTMLHHILQYMLH